MRAALAALLLTGCFSTELRFNQEKRDLGNGAVVFLSGYSNSVALQTSAGTLLVDVKMGCPSRDLRTKLLEAGLSPVRWIAITHPHCDHVQGLPQVIGPDATPEVWGAPVLSALLRGQRVSVVPVEREETRVVGDLEVRLIPFGRAHTNADVAFWFPAKSLLLAGDIFQCGYYPHAEEKDGGSFAGLLEAAKRLLELDAKTIVGGHGAICSNKELKAYVRYLDDVVHGRKTDAPPYKELKAWHTVGSLERNVACARREARAPGGWTAVPKAAEGDLCFPSNYEICE